MKTRFPFYKSLRFRFGAIFGSLLLAFLLGMAVFLYFRVKNQFETGFDRLLSEQAAVQLGKVELNPLTLPVPQSGERFSLYYDNGKKTDTLFYYRRTAVSSGNEDFTRTVSHSRVLETGGDIRIEYSRSSLALQAQISELRSILFIYFPSAFIVALLAGYFLSDFLLRPVSRIVARANEISLQDEIKFLPLPSVEDELYQLTYSFNRMLERIRDQSEQETAFFASAAHELRTPLSLMLTELQVLDTANLSAEVKALVRHQVEAVKRLSGVTNMFLLMSRLKGRPEQTADFQTRVPLTDELIDLLSAFQDRASGKGIVFRVDIVPPDGDFSILINKEHFRVMLNNVLENSIKFGVPGRPVGILAEQFSAGIRLVISNETTEQIANVQNLKDRFVRGSVRHEGFGLGLWIVNTLAKNNQAFFHISFEQNLFTAILEFPRLANQAE